MIDFSLPVTTICRRGNLDASLSKKHLGCWIVLAAAAGLWFSSCSKVSQADAPGLIILQTGRLRGDVVPEGVRHNGALQHYAYIAGYVKKVREVQKDGDTGVVDGFGDGLMFVWVAGMS